MLIFNFNTFNTLCNEAERTYPRECCGILLGREESGQRLVYSLIPAENDVGINRAVSHFQIDPLAVYRAEAAAEKDGMIIAGFYHSHPDCDAVPSDEDIHHMIAGYPIVSLKSGNREYRYCRQQRDNPRGSAKSGYPRNQGCPPPKGRIGKGYDQSNQSKDKNRYLQ